MHITRQFLEEFGQQMTLGQSWKGCISFSCEMQHSCLRISWACCWQGYELGPSQQQCWPSGTTVWWVSVPEALCLHIGACAMHIELLPSLIYAAVLATTMP